MNTDNTALYTFLPHLAIVAGVLFMIFFILWFRGVKKAAKTSSVYEMLSKAEQVRDEVLSELAVVREGKHEAEVRERLALQRLESIQSQMEDWEKTKEQHLEAAKASMMEASTNLSNKLLEDHKRENESSKKDSEERVKKTTEELQQKFQNVFENMKSLSDQVQNFGSSVDVIQNSLLNPQGAGALAEIALENLLKNSGLEKGRDYEMQYTVESSDSGKKLRPDALVFLPGDSALVIDSKSSKFFLESGRADESEVDLKNMELKNSMNKHLNDLINKDYQKVVQKDLEKSKHQVNYGNVHMVMFLPTDISAERIRSIDPKFFDIAYSKKIIPLGPSGLVNILMQAKIAIERVKQEENYHKIIDIVEKMVDSVAKLHTHADGLGKSLNSSMDKYNKFVGSFNVGFLSKVKKINSFGISSDKNKSLLSLTKYETLKSSAEPESEE